MRDKLITEFIGTLLLVFTIALAGASGSPAAPIAIGVALTALVYMGGHISGAHYNPAVTLGAMWAGEFPRRGVVPYIAAQMSGAVGGALLAWMARDKPMLVAPARALALGSPLDIERSVLLVRVLWPALLVEFVFTFMLVLVVLNVACHPKTKGNHYFGAAIGLTIAGAAAAGGAISGGAFNPAVGLGSFLVVLLVAPSAAMFSIVWIYLLGPLVGAALAALVYRSQRAA